MKKKLPGILIGVDAYYPVVDGVARMVELLFKEYSETFENRYIVYPQNVGVNNADSELIQVRSIPAPGNFPYRMALPVLKSNILPKGASQQISIVHAHSPFACGKYVLKFAKKHKIPSVYTFHSKFYDKLYNTIKVKWVAELLYRRVINLINEFDLITTPSEYYKSILIASGVDESKLIVIPNGIQSFVPLAAAQKFEYSSNQFMQKIFQAKNEGKALLLFVGQLISEKNPDFLLRSLAQLKKSGFPFFAMIVGTGDQDKSLRQLAKSLGLADDVLFTGKIMDRTLLDYIYQSCDFFTFPSTYEVQPLVIFEAAQNGLAIVGIEGATGVSDFVFDSDTGFMSPKVEELFAQRIIDAWSDPEKLREIRRNGQQRIPLLSETVADIYVSHYENLIEKVQHR